MMLNFRARQGQEIHRIAVLTGKAVKNRSTDGREKHVGWFRRHNHR